VHIFCLAWVVSIDNSLCRHCDRPALSCILVPVQVGRISYALRPASRILHIWIPVIVTRRHMSIMFIIIMPAAVRTATLSPLTFARHLKNCLIDWQRLWGLFRTRFINLRIIIIIIIIREFIVRLLQLYM